MSKKEEQKQNQEVKEPSKEEQMQQINQQYTELCQQLGDLFVKEEQLKFHKNKLMEQVAQLSETMHKLEQGA